MPDPDWDINTHGRTVPVDPSEGEYVAAIALREPDVRPAMVMTAEEAKARIHELRDFVRDVMIDGEDYGKVTWGGARDRERYILYQPGAQKLLEIYGYYADPKIDKEIENFGTLVLEDGRWQWSELPFFYYRIRTVVVSKRTGLQVGAGYGSTSSRESNYMWREARRKCPQCGKENIRKSNSGSEWYCWNRTGGCGGKWPVGSPAIEGQPLGRVVNEDLADLGNTILKMAVKRSAVAAAIAVTRSAMLFTQDLQEDQDPSNGDDVAPGAAGPVEPEDAAPRATESTNKPVPPKTAGPVAQSDERRTPKPERAGSSPAGPTNVMGVAGGGGSSQPVQGSADTPASAATSAPTSPEKDKELWDLVRDLKLVRKNTADGWMVELPAAAYPVLGLPVAPIFLAHLKRQQVDKLLPVLRREMILKGSKTVEDASAGGGSFVTDEGKRLL